ncbi:MAG: hypothetical protein RMJ14_04400 [Nitrososphaerota archaeon]|nr:hypothetical protein [Aigarchaeota archaeon]MDW8076859.1 hypothetical protein [Nitrososphaerota archaeon]
MLEEEVQKMKEPLERTLMDVRGLINELENPFEYITKLIGTFPVKELKPINEAIKNEQNLHQQLQTERSVERVAQPYTSTGRCSFGVTKFLNVLALTSLMVKLIGHERLLSMLSSTSWRSLIPPDIIVQIIESLEILKKFEGETHSTNSQKTLMIEDGLISAYLLNKLVEGDDDPLFILLLLVINRIQHDNTLRKKE